MPTDRYGLELTTHSPAARDAYVAALDCLLAAGAGIPERFEAAIALDPSLALAHCGYARVLAMHGRGPEARAAAARSRELAISASRRERQHVDAVVLTIEGRPADAYKAMLAHLDEFPRDAMVLSLTTGVFGLSGTSGRPEREQLLLDLLDRLAPHYGEDWWFLAQHAFAECECERYGPAEARAERALALNPANGWAAHSRAHVYYELGDDAGADRFLRAWLPTYPNGSQLHGHISWHAALTALMRGEQDRAGAIFRESIRPLAPNAPPALALTDAVALLWRMELAGCAREQEAWPALSAYARDRFPQAGMTFADVHRAILFAVTGDGASWARLAAELLDNRGRQWAADLAHPLALGFEAFARGEWPAAIDALAPTIESLARISGSRAQRDLVVNTLYAAYVRAGRDGEAKALLASRGARSSSVPAAAAA